MRYFAGLAILVLFAALFSSTSARTEPVCGYKNASGKMIFLKYWTALGEGDQYVDIDVNGDCVYKVTCLEDYSLKLEDC